MRSPTNLTGWPPLLPAMKSSPRQSAFLLAPKRSLCKLVPPLRQNWPRSGSTDCLPTKSEFIVRESPPLLPRKSTRLPENISRPGDLQLWPWAKRKSSATRWLPSAFRFRPCPSRNPGGLAFTEGDRSSPKCPGGAIPDARGGTDRQPVPPCDADRAVRVGDEWGS